MNFEQKTIHSVPQSTKLEVIFQSIVMILEALKFHHNLAALYRASDELAEFKSYYFETAFLYCKPVSAINAVWFNIFGGLSSPNVPRILVSASVAIT